MKNREWFQKTATIDRLMQMTKCLNSTDINLCVLSCFMPEDEVSQYCRTHFDYSVKDMSIPNPCFRCLQSWLNEEHET